MLRILPLMVLVLSLLVACEPSAQESAKSSTAASTVAASSASQVFAVVDTARIFRESEPGKSGVEFLKGIQGDMQIELATLQAKMQADPENVELQQEAQAVFGQLQQRMSAEEQNVVNLLNELVQRTLDEYRTAKNIALIVGAEMALSYDKSVDVTSDVIAAMNKHTLEFKAVMPAPAEAAPAEAAPAEAAPADGNK